MAFCAEYPVMYVGSETSAITKNSASAPRFSSSLRLANASSRTPRATMVPTVGTWFNSKCRWTNVGNMYESSTHVRDESTRGNHGGPDDERQRRQPPDATRDGAVTPIAVDKCP